jgi:hypothetical protein
MITIIVIIVAYSPHTRTVLLERGILYKYRRTDIFSVPIRASLVAAQRNISAAASQRATLQNIVFSVCQAVTSHKSAETEST